MKGTWLKGAEHVEIQYETWSSMLDIMPESHVAECKLSYGTWMKFVSIF
jgi:hypothetical protein